MDPQNTRQPKADRREPAPQRVLLAEDDLELSNLLRRVMTEGGYEVCSVGDGPQLLRALGDGTHYDAVVSDVRMPRLSAIDILGLTFGDPRPPFILLTAFPAEALHQVASELGAVAVLPKPFEVESFLTLLRWAVASERGAAQAT